MTSLSPREKVSFVPAMRSDKQINDSRSGRLRDKARNEKQKSMLLNHVARESVISSEHIVEQSRDLLTTIQSRLDNDDKLARNPVSREMALSLRVQRSNPK
ncbi:MAG: hypothetical protein NVS9B15_07650 [Acidobacteriaceae bacterium]